MQYKRPAAVLAVLLLVVAACSDDAEGGIAVDGPWARTSPNMASAGAAYVELTAVDGDTLIGASVDSSVAGEAQIHEVAEVDLSDGDDMGDMSDGMDMGGAMQMRQIDSLVLPPGETVAFEPGGYHVMLLDLAEPLEPGDRFIVTLQFETAGDVEVEVEVRDEAP